MAQQAVVEIVLSNGNKAGETLKELQQTANRLNKEISNLKPGSDDFVKKAKDFQQVSGRLKEVRGEINGVKESQKALMSEFANLVPFNGQLSSFTQTFSNMRGAVGGVTKSFGAFKTALIGTGIGAIVVAFGTLITYLASTQEGLDKINSVLRPLGTILQRTLGLIQDLGGKAFKGLGEAIKNPKKALEDFGNFIKENFLNRLKSIGVAWEAVQMIFKGDFKEGSKKLLDAWGQGLTGVENITDKIANNLNKAGEWFKEGIDQGKQLHEMTVAIEKAEIELARNRDRLLAQAKQYNDIVEDESASLAEREAAAQKALELQRQVMQMDQAVIDMKIRKMKLEQSFNDTGREQQMELAELEAQSARKQMEIQKMMTTMRNKLNQVRKTEAAERKKEEDEQLQRMQDQADAEKEYVEKQMAEIAELRKKNYEDQKTSDEIRAEANRIALDEAFADRLISEQEYQDLLYALEIDRLQKQLDAQIAYYGAESNEAKKAANAVNSFKVQARLKDKQNAEKTSDEKSKDEKEAADASIGIASNVFGNLANQYEQGSEEYKKFAYLQAQADTISASLAAYKSTAAIPIVGPVLAPIAAATALIFGQIKASQILKVKKAEHGEFLSGKRHSQGGIMVNAEDGEVILNRNVGLDPRGLAMASELNAMYGGIRFMESGGPVNPLSMQQIAAQAPAVSGGSTFQAGDQFQKTVLAYMQKMDAWASTLRVVNNLQQTREGLNVINKLEADSGF